MRWTVAIGTALVWLAIAPAASAITQGQLDGGRHPMVGALIGTFDGVTRPYCSGALVSPTVVLTAAHCDIGSEQVVLTFDEQHGPEARLHAGTFVPHPEHRPAQSDPRDVAVVLLDEPIRDIAPARLPSRRLLDAMRADGSLDQDTRFTSVGYGGRAAETGPGGQTNPHFNVREFASGSFNALNPGFLRLSQNARHGDGGTCAGDSGGPVFLGAGRSETDVVVSTTITGDMFCRATNVTQRMDTDSARRFLGRYVRLP